MQEVIDELKNMPGVRIDSVKAKKSGDINVTLGNGFYGTVGRFKVPEPGKTTSDSYAMLDIRVNLKNGVLSLSTYHDDAIALKFLQAFRSGKIVKDT